MSPVTRRKISRVLAGLTALAGIMTGEYWYLTSHRPLQVVVTYERKIEFGGPFTLTDQNGVARRDAEFRGKLMVVYFGNTHCRDVCPIELHKMSEAMDLLGKNGEAVQPIFISFDPDRDAGDRLREYLKNFHPRILGLTGSEEEIAKAAGAYHVTYDRVELSGGDYDYDHSSLIFLMDRHGRHIDHFGTTFSAKTIAEAVSGVL